MAVTAFPSTEESHDLTLLNVARLFTRLEHNLLSPGTELRTLHKSELQRLRVAKVCLYRVFLYNSRSYGRGCVYVNDAPLWLQARSLGPLLTSCP